MFPNRRNRVHNEQYLDKIRHLTLATGSLTATLNAYDHVVIVTNSSGEGVITLPSVTEAAGLFYFIYLTDDSGTSVDIKAGADATYTATAIADGSGTSIDLATGAELATAGEYVLLFCTGISWHIIACSSGVVETT